MKTLKRRKIEYFGKIVPQYERLILQEKIEERRGGGRRKISWMKNIREWAGIPRTGDLMRAAEEEKMERKLNCR